jgi:hypothetical protein
MSTKICKTCSTEKELSYYSKRNSSRDGYRNICKSCMNAQARTRFQNPETLERKRNSSKKFAKKWRKSLREEVLEAYGNRCTCCGEDTLEFLTIDHIHNDGHLERKMMRQGKFYSELKKRNFPRDRYQILCWNCNAAKAYYGVCPHKRKQDE